MISDESRDPTNYTVFWSILFVSINSSKGSAAAIDNWGEWAQMIEDYGNTIFWFSLRETHKIRYDLSTTRVNIRGQILRLIEVRERIREGTRKRDEDDRTIGHSQIIIDWDKFRADRRESYHKRREVDRRRGEEGSEGTREKEKVIEIQNRMNKHGEKRTKMRN